MEWSTLEQYYAADIEIRAFCRGDANADPPTIQFEPGKFEDR